MGCLCGIAQGMAAEDGRKRAEEMNRLLKIRYEIHYEHMKNSSLETAKIEMPHPIKKFSFTDPTKIAKRDILKFIKCNTPHVKINILHFHQI